MKCKPGDLAIICCPNPDYDGKLVEVLYLAPQASFLLPDGYPHLPSPPECWVIKSLGTPFTGPCYEMGVLNGARETMYGAGADARLKPLPGLSVEETEKERVPA